MSKGFFITFLTIMILGMGNFNGFSNTQDKQVIETDKAPAAIGPYSQAVLYGNFIFVSGQIPIDPKTGKLVKGGFETQVTQVLVNIQEILKKAGSSMKNVVKATVFLSDLNNYRSLNKIYGSYFKKPYPARAAVQVARLPLDVMVEIEVIAVKPVANKRSKTK